MPNGYIRGLGAAWLAVAMFGLASCSSSHNSPRLSSPPSSASPSPAGSTGSATSIATPDVKAQLLQLSDLPAGWSVNHTPKSNSSEPDCVKNATNFKSEDKAKAEADFQNGSNGVPQIDDEVVFMPGAAQSAMSEFRRLMAGCGQISITADGHTFSGTIGQMSFPSFGAETQAYQMNLATNTGGLNITLGFDVILARFVNDEILLFAYADLGTPDVSQVQQYAEKAVSKVSSVSR